MIKNSKSSLALVRQTELLVEHVAKFVCGLQSPLNQSLLYVVTTYLIHTIKPCELVLDAAFKLSAKLAVEVKWSRLEEHTLENTIITGHRGMAVVR